MKTLPYLQIARVDHWFKNIFILPGMIAASFLEPATGVQGQWAVASFLAACLVASSNYVINEILDARTDRHHPEKRLRPIAAGRASVPLAYLEWALLALVGFAIGSSVSAPLFLSLAALWLMGLVYNVPPVRSKEIPYLDVLSEAINNPLRLLIGWYGVGATGFPPSSFLLAYWIIGAYLMAAKRFAEYRTISNPETAARYRASFRHYTQEKLSNAMLVFAAGFMFFMGVILVKYHPEFLLSCPLLLLYLAYYNHLAYRRGSVAEHPERLYRDPTLMVLTILLAAALWGLAYVKIPLLPDWLGISGRAW